MLKKITSSIQYDFLFFIYTPQIYPNHEKSGGTILPLFSGGQNNHLSFALENIKNVPQYETKGMDHFAF